MVARRSGHARFGRVLAGTAVATAATALAGGAASADVDSAWYRSLAKPPFQPPPQAFPIAWTALYADIAVSSARAIHRLGQDGRKDEQRALVGALAVNLVLNASWSWVFFKAHRLGSATVVAAALAASSSDLAVRAAAADRTSGVALTPYPLWCSFATVLSGAIWRRNR